MADVSLVCVYRTEELLKTPKKILNFLTVGERYRDSWGTQQGFPIEIQTVAAYYLEWRMEEETVLRMSKLTALPIFWTAMAS